MTTLARYGKRAFTLVELLVVIGIIALLIAILMPALSRARKQALTASCGSNARQQTYAAIAYANDWKQELPTKIGYFVGDNYGKDLNWPVRLPIIGFDTLTRADPMTHCAWNRWAPPNGDPGIGGWGYLMRDYLKNDFDITVCPDGWWDRAALLQKFPGPYGECYPPDNIIMRAHTYFWLPHRRLSAQNCFCGGIYPAPDCVQDRPENIARTASGTPELLIVADFLGWGDWYAGVGPGDAYIVGNHPNTAARGGFNYSGFGGTAGPDALTYYDPCSPASSPPEDLPMGSNRTRIDCRTTWVPWQDLEKFRWGWRPSTGGSATFHIW